MNSMHLFGFVCVLAACVCIGLFVGSIVAVVLRSVTWNMKGRPNDYDQ